MQDIINKTIEKYYDSEKRIEIIRRHLRINYHTNIDTDSIKKRIRLIQQRKPALGFNS